ncbi:hypothetical protein C0J52_26120 [Blattella germanica]|nr:hypothetical protein C0J52_26120 [Blattella germanica]
MNANVQLAQKESSGGIWNELVGICGDFEGVHTIKVIPKANKCGDSKDGRKPYNILTGRGETNCWRLLSLHFDEENPDVRFRRKDWMEIQKHHK